MPVVVTREIEHARPLYIQRDILVLGKLIKKMAGVSAFVTAAPIVGAAHVSARADAQVRPAVPLAAGIQADRDDRGFLRCGNDSKGDQQQQGAVKHLFN